MRGNWEAIIKDPHFIEKTNEIRESLEKELEQLNTEKMEYSLFNGYSAIPLYYSYCYKYTKDERYLSLCADWIDKLLNGLTHENSIETSFGYGVMGLAWVIQHVMEQGVIDADDEILGSFDELLKDHLENNLVNPEYDLFTGIVGYLIYLTDRWRLSKSKQQQLLIEKCISLLDLTLVRNDKIQQETWTSFTFTRDNVLKENIVDFGLAHGLPSILRVLADSAVVLPDNHRVKEMIENTLEVIEKYAFYKAEGNIYTKNYLELNEGNPAESIHPGRIAWCYGNLGIALTYTNLPDEFIPAHLKEREIEKLMQETKREIVNTGVIDACLCHGYLGNALIYNHFYQRTGRDDFKLAATRLYEYTLSSNNECKLKTWHGANKGYVEDFALLEGKIGMVLALLSAISDVRPDWDKCMLIS